MGLRFSECPETSANDSVKVTVSNFGAQKVDSRIGATELIIKHKPKVVER